MQRSRRHAAAAVRASPVGVRARAFRLCLLERSAFGEGPRRKRGVGTRAAATHIAPESLFLAWSAVIAIAGKQLTFC